MVGKVTEGGQAIRRSNRQAGETEKLPLVSSNKLRGVVRKHTEDSILE